MQAVSGRHGLAAPVPTSCAVAHPSSPAFMLGTISLLAQEQYSTLSILTNPRQTHPLRPPGMQLAAILPHDLFLCINSKKKKKKKKSQKPCKQPLQMQACCTYQVCDGGLARWQLGPGWGPWWWGWWGAAGGQWRAGASWGRGACNRDGASAAHQHTDPAPRSWWGGDRVSPPQFPHDGCSRAAGLHSGACCDCCSAHRDDPSTHSLAALPKLEKMMHWE